MKILYVLDPIRGLQESNSIRETSIHQVIARIKSGKPINSKMIGSITNDLGKPLTYDQAVLSVPKDMQTPQVLSLLRQVTNQAEIDADPLVGQNVLGQRVMK